MKIMGIRTNTTTVVLIGVFLVIVLGGRFIFNHTLPKDDRGVVDTTAQIATSSTQATSASENKTTQKVATSSDAMPSCADALRAEVAQKKITYAKGQILVTFVPNVVYQKVKDVLAVYGLVVQNEVESQASFKSRHLVTAAVAPGQEIVKVCQLRSNPQVKYAGLDVYLNLHE